MASATRRGVTIIIAKHVPIMIKSGSFIHLCPPKFSAACGEPICRARRTNVRSVSPLLALQVSPTPAGLFIALRRRLLVFLLVQHHLIKDLGGEHVAHLTADVAFGEADGEALAAPDHADPAVGVDPHAGEFLGVGDAAAEGCLEDEGLGALWGGLDPQ